MDDQKSDKKFVDGLRFFKKRDNAPDFVKGRLSIEPTKLMAFLKENKEHMKDGYFGIDMLLSQKGTIYLVLDTYKKPVPKEEDPFAGILDTPEEIDPEAIPF